MSQASPEVATAASPPSLASGSVSSLARGNAKLPKAWKSAASPSDLSSSITLASNQTAPASREVRSAAAPPATVFESTGKAKQKKKTSKLEVKTILQPSRNRKPVLAGSMNCEDKIPKNPYSQTKAPAVGTNSEKPTALQSNQHRDNPSAGYNLLQSTDEDFPSLSASFSPRGVQNEHRVKLKAPQAAAKRNTSDSRSQPENSKRPPLESKNISKKATRTFANVDFGSNTPAGSQLRTHPCTRATGSKLAPYIAIASTSHHEISGGITTPDTRDLAGGEHDLLRLLEQGKMGIPTKAGRVRIRPRKKKFSALKKKVLEERLRKWRELHPESAPIYSSTGDDRLSSSVALLGFVDIDGVEDDDEFEEIMENLLDFATKIGSVKRVVIPRSFGDWEGGKVVPSFVDYLDCNLAKAAVDCWSGVVLGGTQLNARILVSADGSEPPEDFDDWKSWCVRASKVEGLTATNGCHTTLENALSDEDFEDDEGLEESLADAHFVGRERTAWLLLRYKCSAQAARESAKKLSEVVIGGTAFIARVEGDLSYSDVDACERTLVLRNVLTDDDFEDEDCLQESLEDLRELAKPFGCIENVVANKDDTSVWVVFSAFEETKLALSTFDGMVIGGKEISASLLLTQGANETLQLPTDKTSVGLAAPATLFSGDKRIAERFAECKRVPKIPSSGKPRNYAEILSPDDSAVKPLLSEMLSELMRLQRRAMEEKSTKARRRLVMGLREVARGIRSHKVKMVIMANNLDEYGVIDDKLQEILDLCQKEDVPVFFEFSKRTLGKAIGKSIKVAVVGIQSADGAQQQFKKLVSLAAKPSKENAIS
jgi:selenocysteine insertion sequence-binding protein 2